MSNSGLRLLLLLASVLCVTEAKAQIAYSTLLPGNAFDTGAGAGIEGATYPGPDPESIAAAFVPTVSGNLSSIDVAVWSQKLSFLPTIPDNHFQLNLFANSLDGGPDTDIILASGIITAPTNGTLETFTYSGPSLDLMAGQTYWLALSPSQSDTFGAWCWSSPTVISTLPVYFSTDGGSTYMAQFGGDPPVAFSVDIETVPEPASYMLLLGGLVALGLLKFRFWQRRS
jgi:hypothetical protein